MLVRTNRAARCYMVELAGQALNADEGYQERLKAASELFLPGTYDKVYQSID